MKFIAGSFLVILASTLYTTGQVPDSVKFRSLKPRDFYNLYKMTDSAVLLDVRELFEFRKVRIKDAANIPSSGSIEQAADSINKNLSLFIYCYSGGRSRKAARIFYDKGFRKLYNLEGGITAWKKEKMPVARGRIKKRIA